MSDEIEAVVVGGIDLGEADRLLRLVSATEGRGAVVARGMRSSRKRFVGAGELGTRLRITRGRSTGLASATAIERLDGPNRARTEIERIGLLAYGCELCAALCPEGSAAPKLYQLLLHWLALLEGVPRPGEASRIALEAKAATFAGLAPTLTHCAVCADPLDDPAVFDAEIGGGAHARCSGGRPIEAAALRALDELRRTPLAETPERAAPGGAEWLLADFVQHQLGRPLASRAWLLSIDRR
ncbi:MAG: DNA repair protein RecO [Myxococcota bacterium]